MICEGILLTLTALRPLMWDDDGSPTRLYSYPEDYKPGDTLCIEIKSGLFVFSTDGTIDLCSERGELLVRRIGDVDVYRIEARPVKALVGYYIPESCERLSDQE